MTSFIIVFDYCGDDGGLRVRLRATVEVMGKKDSYLITNIQIDGRERVIELPITTLRKTADKWVHMDSGRASDLSERVGDAIEACLSGRATWS